MPLESGKSESAFKHNVETEVAAGKPQKQAVAIAYSERGDNSDIAKKLKNLKNRRDPDNTESEDEAIKAAGIMYLCDNAVLLCRRAGEFSSGLWAFPGGKLEENETPEEAARRESSEEINYNPNETLQQIDFTQGEEVEFTTFLCNCKKFNPVLNEEHDGFIWADLSSLPSPLHPGVQKTLCEYGMNAPVAMDSAREVDLNGFITIEKNPISRSGIFPYLGKSLPGAEDPNKVYYVYRPDSELSDLEAIESFKLLPLFDDHTMAGPENEGFTPAETVGTHGTTGETVEFEDGVLYATLKIFSQTLADMIKIGKRDLSLGYRCVYEKTSGIFNGQAYQYIQRRLRGNHLALVNEARCDVSVLDHQLAFDHFDLVLDTEELSTMADKDTKENKGDQEAKDKAKDAAGAEGEGSGGESGEMTMEQAHAFMKDVMPKLAKMNELMKKHMGGGEEEKGATDPAQDDYSGKPTTSPKTGTKNGVQNDGKDEDKEAMDAAIKDLSKQLTTLQKDGFKTIMAEAKGRDELADKLSFHVGAFDHAEMTKAEVAAYGVSKLGIPCTKGQELAALNGFLHNRQIDNTRITMDSATTGAGLYKKKSA